MSSKILMFDYLPSMLISKILILVDYSSKYASHFIACLSRPSLGPGLHFGLLLGHLAICWTAAAIVLHLIIVLAFFPSGVFFCKSTVILLYIYPSAQQVNASKLHSIKVSFPCGILNIFHADCRIFRITSSLLSELFITLFSNL